MPVLITDVLARDYARSTWGWGAHESALRSSVF